MKAPGFFSGHDTELEADILVIGSGAGGATVAATAAALGYSVLVLEEGPYVSASKAPARLASSMNQLWRHGGMTVAYGAPPIAYAEGCCVGGSTEINSAIFQRIPPSLLAKWSRHYGIDHFDEDALAPYYDWASAIVNASLTPGPLGPPSELLAKAGKAMNWEVKDLERGQRSCVGTNMCALACPTGGKQSMTATLIPEALEKGARVIHAAKVRRFLMRGRRVTGAEIVVQDENGGKRKTVARARKVFLCAGAIQTPAILQRSGLGQRAGRRLRLHPTLKCLAFFDEDINAQDYRLPLTAITEFMPDIRMGGSFFTPATFGMALAEDWRQRSGYMKSMRRAVIYYAMTAASGKGRVFAPIGGAAPIVTYKMDKADWHHLGQGSALLGEALLKIGAKHVLPSIAGHPGWHTEAAAVRARNEPLPHNRSQLMTIHLFGSCPMGQEKSLCATDSFGRLHNADNLYIADAGLIPEAPGVNPQATVMALARRNVLHWLIDNPKAE